MIEEQTKIENMIYTIRGKQVMLDSDLAKLYQCKNGTKSINLSVKRHINRFPERFMFQLTIDEYQNLKFQFETSNKKTHGGIRKLPYVFTEQGVAMLSSVLKTPIAEEVSIRIMDAFVEMKKYINNSIIEQKYVNELVFEHDFEIKLLKQTFDKLNEKQKTSTIFFQGQIYDAYSLLIDILKEAKNQIIIIDNYIDKNILDYISLLEVKVTVITNSYNKIDIKKYKQQYHNLEIKINNTFHDRFILIDNKTLYHCGASFKDLGKKCFAINKIEDKDLINKINYSIRK